MSRIQGLGRNKLALVHAVMIITAGGILSLPCLLYGFPGGGHDGFAHLTWYVQFSEQLWAGEFYPRWLINENSGLGGPVFFYYGPIPYHISSLLRPFFNSDPFGWRQLGLSAGLALIASGFSAYLWIKNMTNEKAAMIGAILYMIMPYHVAIDLYERAAFSEFWAFVWMPLSLFFVKRIKGGHRFAILGMAVSFALLIMTHLPTTLIFSIVPIGYLLTEMHSSLRTSAIWSTLSAMILGTLLSALYLLPALSTQEYVNIRRDGIWTLYLDNYLFAELMPAQLFRVELTLVVLGMILLAFCATLLYGLSSERKLGRQMLFWIVVGMISVYMMTPASKPMIQLVPVLHRIQFPWRYNAILVLATVAITAIGIHALRKPHSIKVIGLSAISALLVASWFVIDVWQGVQESKVDQAPINKTIERGTFDYNYRPRWVQTNIKDYAGDMAKINIDSGTGAVEIERWKPREIVLKIDTLDGMVLTVGQLYYPGWTAQIIGEPCCLPVQPTRSTGLLNIPVPRGTYEVALRLVVSTQELAGQLISATSAITVLLLAIWFGIGHYKMRPWGGVYGQNWIQRRKS